VAMLDPEGRDDRDESDPEQAVQGLAPAQRAQSASRLVQLPFLVVAERERFGGFDSLLQLRPGDLQIIEFHCSPPHQAANQQAPSAAGA
jgi:hypothetical protein